MPLKKRRAREQKKWNLLNFYNKSSGESELGIMRQLKVPLPVSKLLLRDTAMTFNCSHICRTSLEKVASTADNQGYAFAHHETVKNEVDSAEWGKLESSFVSIPQEEYSNPQKIRARWVSYGYIDPGNERLWFDAPTFDETTGDEFSRYNLEDNTNPEAKGIDRKYTAIPKDIEKNLAFQKLIYLGYLMTPVLERDKALQRIQAHIIRYTPREDAPSIATPDTFHQDDFSFCVFLLERSNVEGGVNYFAPTDCAGKMLSEVGGQFLCEKTLSDPLSAYAVNDRKVAHYVSSITADGDPATRTILILAFKPMRERKLVETWVPEANICDVVEHFPDEIEGPDAFTAKAIVPLHPSDQYRQMFVLESKKADRDIVAVKAW